MNITPSVPSIESRWRPLVEGDAGVRLCHTAQGTAEAGIAALTAPDRAHSAGSVAGGAAGAALAANYVLRDRSRAVTLVNRSWQAAAQRHDQSLFSGLAGPGWVAEVMAADDPDGEASVDLTEDLARLLEEEVPEWAGHFDLISGLVGLGVFGLERAERTRDWALVDLVVQRLLARMRRGEHEGTWSTDPGLLPPHQLEVAPHGQIDLGLAHGIPGALAFLAMVHLRGRTGPEVDRALRCGVAWLLERQGEQVGHRFTAVIPEGSDPVPHRGSRVAWCYGDLSVAAGIAQVGRALAMPEWIAIASQLARETLVRPFPENGVVEGNVCHGVAGNVLVAAYVAALSNDVPLREAALAHLAALDRFVLPGSVPALFRSRNPSDDRRRMLWSVDHGLLTGGMGVSLALAAITGPVFPRWCRLLLLDGRMLER